MNIYILLIINSLVSSIGSALGLTLFEAYLKPMLNKIQKVKKDVKDS